jgi:putative ABC transport system substrate-binding protein
MILSAPGLRRAWRGLAEPSPDFRSLRTRPLLAKYGPSLFDLFRRSANWIDKILKGAKPADLAIEQPTLFELVINAKTAKALGLTMPRSLLLRADRIIDR